MHAVLRIDDETRIALFHFVAIGNFIDPRRAVEPRGLAELGQILAHRYRGIAQSQMDRLVFLMIGVGEKHRG